MCFSLLLFVCVCILHRQSENVKNVPVNILWMKKKKMVQKEALNDLLMLNELQLKFLMLNISKIKYFYEWQSSSALH